MAAIQGNSPKVVVTAPGVVILMLTPLARTRSGLGTPQSPAVYGGGVEVEVVVTVLDWGWVQHTCPVLQYLVSSGGHAEHGPCLLTFSR